jgi:DNA invertase Pin-like site-specific DNA recombinase
MAIVTKIHAIRALRGDEAASKEILRAIVAAKGSKQKAAVELGIGNSTIYRLIGELEIGEKIDKVCQEHGFRSRAGRARGKVPPGTRRKIAAARRKAKVD